MTIDVRESREDDIWTGVSLTAVALAAGLTVAGTAAAGPHQTDSYQVDPSEYAGEWAAGAESAPFDGGGSLASDEAFYGAGSYEGTGDTSEAGLMAEGAIPAGPTGELSAEEFEALLALPAVGGGVGQEVVLGPDTRSRLYTTTFPVRAVALITFTGGRCTGFMIGHNTVATAGHCVHTGGSGGAWRTSVEVIPAQNGGVQPYGKCQARSLYSVTGWTVSNNADYDYGAIKLNCSIGNTTGWFGFRSGAGTNTPSIITGYPGDKPLDMWQSADRVRGVSTRQMFYSNDTIGGMSGSPVWEDWWNGTSRGAYAVGIHAYGPYGSGLRGTYNHGTRIQSPVSTNLQNWKNAP
jgi:glutamyl endopeptidase